MGTEVSSQAVLVVGITEVGAALAVTDSSSHYIVDIDPTRTPT